MVKLVLCMLLALGLAMMVLQLRQQRLELNYKVNQLHRQIESQQAKLWNQQVQIAVYTAPNAIQQTVTVHDLHLVPRTGITRSASGMETDPDAE